MNYFEIYKDVLSYYLVNLILDKFFLNEYDNYSIFNIPEYLPTEFVGA